MSEGSLRHDAFTDSEEMVGEFIRVLYLHGGYYEMMDPLVRFYTENDGYQWRFGVHFDATDVSKRGQDIISIDPDGLTYKERGVLVNAYTGHGLHAPSVMIQTEPPEHGVSIDEKQERVERMEIKYD